MGSDQARQERAIQKARAIIEEAEKRRALNDANGFEEFRNGNYKILQSGEASNGLARLIQKKYLQEGLDSIEIFLERLRDGICDQDVSVRENALVTVCRFSSSIQNDADEETLKKLYIILVNWIRNEDSFLSGYGAACKQLHDITKALLSKQLWQEVEPLLVTINQIQDGVLRKNSAIQNITIKIQENVATRNILEELTGEFFNPATQRENEAESLLVNMGRRAVIFLLNKLMHSEDRDERIKYLGLIAKTGKSGVPVYADCLKRNPPWFIVRNIILIISEIGDSSLYPMVRQYLRHNDLRVQQQVIHCIAKFGGDRMKARLLEALSLVNDDLKIQLVMELGRMKGNEIVEGLTDLLDKRTTFQKRSTQSLISKICIALRFFPTEKSMRALKEIIEEYESVNRDDNQIINSARESLAVIEPQIRHDKKSLANNKVENIRFDGDPVERENLKNRIREIEDKIFLILEEDDLEKACEYILSQIRIVASVKDFEMAEKLRDRLLEVNPLALNEVIQAGEFIEQEKGSSITNHHLSLWHELYDHMTVEEFNAIYYAMRQQTYQQNEVIIKSGETDSSLYFINSGYASLSCQFDRENIFLKRLQSGDIFGVSEFFSVSVWTSSVTAQTDCQINVLSYDSFMKLTEEYPQLELKLQEYCIKHDILPDLVKMSGKERRKFPRYPVSIIVSSTLLDHYGNVGKRSFKGEMLDISMGGFAFSIHISSKENTRLLLGRQIVSEIRIGRGKILRCTGTVVGVKYKKLNEKDYIIHVKFHVRLDQTKVMQVVNLVM